MSRCAGWGERRFKAPILIPPIACGLSRGQKIVINDVNGEYVSVASGILGELLRLTNHSTVLAAAFNEKAETLHYTLKERAEELGLPTRGGVANAVIFSPPYCNIKRGSLRGFRKKPQKTFMEGNYRAWIIQLISSAYIMVRLFGWVVVVVKDSVATRAEHPPIPETVEEAMKHVGLREIEKHVFALKKASAYAEYHRSRGHAYEHLAHEYVIAGRKLPKRKTEEVTPV